MIYELSEIKNLRKKLNLSQTELSNIAGVSQSLIAKIEAGRIDPTFSNAMRIFNAISALANEQEIKAAELMNNKIISLNPSESVRDAVSKMKKHEISQMPVIDGEKVQGIVSESTLLDAAISNKGALSVLDIMQEAPPIVSKDATLTVISNLLKYFPMVIVSCKGKLCGVITKSDVLRKMV